MTVLQINGTKVLKSGTDFRMMSQLTLTFHEKSKKVDVDVEQIVIDSKVPEDKEVRDVVREYESEYLPPFITCHCDVIIILNTCHVAQKA